MTDLIIVGASGFGRELLNMIEEINSIEPTWNVLGFIDDDLHALDGFDIKCKVLGTIKDWKPVGEELYALAIASPKIKERIVPQLKEKSVKFATIISPTAEFGKRTIIGEGVIVFAGARGSVDISIGNYVFFNSRVNVGHDAVIGDYSTIAPYVCISGKTEIGKCVNVGVQASTYPGVKIGDYATVGMGSAVISRVKPGTTVMGVPARAIF